MKSLSSCTILLLIAFAGLCIAAAEQTKDKDVDMILDLKVPMRDGVLLSATVWKPSVMESPLPTILVFTPYISDESQGRGMFFARHGYVYVSIDVRGRGNSAGIYYPLEGDKHSKDIHDAIKWLAGQPWSDGRFVMRGGSYRGTVQWQALMEKPDELKTIVPTAAAYPGVDYPAFKNIFTSYDSRWLAFTSGLTGNAQLFADEDYWSGKFLKMYLEHIPYSRLWEIVGIQQRLFERWLQHPCLDEFWLSFSPSPDVLSTIDIPILTITGFFDDDQPGAMMHYNQFMRYAGEEAKARHFLLIGPWDHPGTRHPARELGGLTFGENSVIDMEELHLQWYDWVLKGGARPEILKDRVNYYVIGPNVWKHAPTLEAVSNGERIWYLSSPGSDAHDVFNSGVLSSEPAGNEPPDSFEYDPLNTDIGVKEASGAAGSFMDQSEAFRGEKVIYHSPSLPADIEVTGKMKLEVWISLNVPDTDLQVSVYEIKRDGTGIALGSDIMRARYRKSLSKAELVTPGEIELYTFDGFYLLSRVLSEGSRLRLIISSSNTPQLQKNYNSGGDVAEETAKDARTAVITVYHDDRHQSRLVLPVMSDKGKQ
jgi:putative CocE/NonD family hydrolase